ncbi:NAD(P)-dependent alcohol dehydrogenase [Niveispirillum sp. BGYR6]|uniref:NAD(P)-dependent alcohol dehydrogenase n=1 Tax=Niveispirillum sp. BGYR6 TaxID=2971249 RepID=UPI0022B9A287|nr:NAD(P)-dependent alcohol dehydrogenase [Niveispirillum sp. BGYR6]MDG5493282.1 NAD(P)-dependent alcohol dehydrogenase [Niveispirillum sp. BGYR6]
MDIQAAVTRSPQADFTIEPVQMAPPRDHEVVVRIAGVGLCHTDLVARDQFIPIPLPAVLGHEGAGVVEAVGAAVTKVKPGDTVVLGFNSCGTCARCRDNLPSYCRDFPVLNYPGARPDGSSGLSQDGNRISGHFFGQSSFASHALAHERNVVKVDASGLDLSILGPLGCGFQTGAGGVMRSLACHPGSSIAIFGGGPVGLAAVMGAVIQNCATIILVEPVAARRQMALELGATHVIDPAAGDVTAAIRAIVPDGIDYGFETSGREEVVAAALAALGSHGLLGLVGVPPRPDSTLPINLAAFITYGHRIVGIIEGDSDPDRFIPELIALHRQGRFPFDRLIRTFPLAQINQAVATQHQGGCIKAVLLP